MLSNIILTSIYVLALQDNKYFISKLSKDKGDMIDSFISHTNTTNLHSIFGNGAYWLELYPIVKVDKVIEEVIEDYACDKCAPKRSKAIRKTRVWKLPKNLIVVLKRFTYDGNKIHTPIEPFGPELSLHDLFSQSSPHKKSCDYQLNSIVDHHGSSRGGHYTAQAKHRSEKKWFLYDDQNVHSIEGPSMGESSYIFFLESK